MKYFHIIFFILTILIIGNIFGIGITNIIRYNNYKLRHNNLIKNISHEIKVKKKHQAILEKNRDNNFWEEQAKIKLGYIKENEYLYIIKKP